MVTTAAPLSRPQPSEGACRSKTHSKSIETKSFHCNTGKKKARVSHGPRPMGSQKPHPPKAPAPPQKEMPTWHSRRKIVGSQSTTSPPPLCAGISCSWPLPNFALDPFFLLGFSSCHLWVNVAWPDQHNHPIPSNRSTNVMRAKHKRVDWPSISIRSRSSLLLFLVSSCLGPWGAVHAFIPRSNAARAHNTAATNPANSARSVWTAAGGRVLLCFVVVTAHGARAERSVCGHGGLKGGGIPPCPLHCAQPVKMPAAQGLGSAFAPSPSRVSGP